METKIIVVTNQKGGAGKTTVSVQLAGALARRGFKVQLADADKQFTSTRWIAAAPDDRPFNACVAGVAAAKEKVHREIRKGVGIFDFIVVDCPPAIESVIPQSALMVADLALVPIVPSPPDLWAGQGIKYLLSQVDALRDGLESRLLLNMVPATRLARDISTILEDFDIELMNCQLGYRTAYRQAAVVGGTVYDVEGATAAMAEIDKLTDSVLHILRSTAHAPHAAQDTHAAHTTYGIEGPHGEAN